VEQSSSKNRRFIRGSTESYKSGGVVVLDRLGVAKGLEDGVGLQQLLLQLPLDGQQENSDILTTLSIFKSNKSGRFSAVDSDSTADTSGEPRIIMIRHSFNRTVLLEENYQHTYV